jgi:hypothetical protein
MRYEAGSDWSAARPTRRSRMESGMPCRGTGRLTGEDIASMAARQLLGRQRLRCLISMISVAVLAVQAAASGASAAAQATAGPGPFQQVSYRGYTFEVLRDWTVIRLAQAPHTCVRFNRNALYLGVPSSNQNCPSLMTGNTESVLIQPARRSLAVSSVEDPVARNITVTAPRIRVTAKFGWHPGQIYRFLQRASLPLPIVDAPDPNVPVLTTSVTDPVTPDAQEPQLLAADGPLIPQQNENYTGLGFDTCTAPSPADMLAWRNDSPYRAVGIYLGGSDAACDQPNLTPDWLLQSALGGYHFIPMYVGPQAELGELTAPTQQGISAADDAVMLAKQLGFGPRTPVYYDMEAYLPGQTTAVLQFLSAWTSTLHSLGYLSGVYSSSDSGISDLAQQYYSHTYAMPDVIFDAWWNGEANTSDPVFSGGQWPNHMRIHQFAGNVTQSYGGDVIQVDQDYMDVQLPLPAPTPTPTPTPTPAPTPSPSSTPGPSPTSTGTPSPHPTPPTCTSPSS